LHESRPGPPRLGMQDGARAVCGTGDSDERGLALAEDPRFLARDVLDRRTEDVEMVRRDVRDDRDVGRQNVCRVEPPADPDLDHPDRDARAPEQLEGRDRERLEVRRAAAARRRYRRDEPEHLIESLPEDVDVPDTDALRDGNEMWRGVEPAADAGGRQEGRD